MSREDLGLILFLGPSVIMLVAMALMMPVGVVLGVYAICQGNTNGWKVLAFCLPATSMLAGLWVLRK